MYVKDFMKQRGKEGRKKGSMVPECCPSTPRPLRKKKEIRKGVFFENAPSPRAPLPSAPTPAATRQLQKQPQRGDSGFLQKNKPGGCFGEEEGLLFIFSKKKVKAGDIEFFTQIHYGQLIRISQQATCF
jgi:hypothetical protein